MMTEKLLASLRGRLSFTPVMNDGFGIGVGWTNEHVYLELGLWTLLWERN